MEEEKRKEMAAEEARYKEEEQKEALTKARTQLYYQNDRVKGLNVSTSITIQHRRYYI